MTDWQQRFLDNLAGGDSAAEAAADADQKKIAGLENHVGECNQMIDALESELDKERGKTESLHDRIAIMWEAASTDEKKRIQEAEKSAKLIATLNCQLNESMTKLANEKRALLACKRRCTKLEKSLEAHRSDRS